MYANDVQVGQFFDRLAGAKPPAQKSTKTVENDEPKIQADQKVHQNVFPFTKFVFVVVAIGASFLFGMAYQKTQDAKVSRVLGTTGTGTGSSNGSSSSGNSIGGFSGGGGYGRFGSTGITSAQVTSISSSSITVKDSSGNSSTYSITGNTLISDSDQVVDTSDIQTGDTVIVIPDRMDTSTARRIIVNPDTSSSQPSIDPGETQIN